jgi:hypothetical protein
MQKLILTLTWILAAGAFVSAQTSTTTYMPQIAAGAAGGIVWNTHLTIMNAAEIGTSPANVTITFTKSDGTAFNVASALRNLVTGAPAGSGNTIAFQISGGQSRFFLMDAASLPLGVGFARVTSTAPVAATSVFVSAYASSGHDIGEAGVSAAAALSRQALFVLSTDWNNTAIAVANPNSADASVTFTLYTTAGTVQFTPAVRNLPANNQTAFLITELFPSIGTAFVGTVRMTTSDATPVSAATLLLHPDAQFGALPVVPMP